MDELTSLEERVRLMEQELDELTALLESRKRTFRDRLGPVTFIHLHRDGRNASDASREASQPLF